MSFNYFVFDWKDWAEKNVGKIENACYQHFLLFPQSFTGVVKIEDCAVKGQTSNISRKIARLIDTRNILRKGANAWNKQLCLFMPSPQ